MPEFETPPLFNPDTFEPTVPDEEAGVSDSSEAPTHTEPAPGRPGPAERAGGHPSRHRGVYVEQVGDLPPGDHVETNGAVLRTREDLAYLQANPGNPDGLAEARRSIEATRQDPKGPQSHPYAVGEGFDDSIFDIDKPEWPILNEPSGAKPTTDDGHKRVPFIPPDKPKPSLPGEARRALYRNRPDR